MTEFKLGLGPCEVTNSSITFRYCFKGGKVKSRPGGFWKKLGTISSAFVIKNIAHDCTVFGNDGGEVYLDTEDTENSNKFGNNGTNGMFFPHYYPELYPITEPDNVYLKFCVIGQQRISSKSDFIRIGEFNQMFGFFSEPNDTLCPVLDSPHGILRATKEKIFIDLENSGPSSRAVKGSPPFLFDANKDAEVGVCIYDPSKGETN